MATLTTNILDLPPVTMAVTVATNEDWIDGLAYQDNATPPNPIDLTGITFEMELRAVESALTVVLSASTANGLIIVNDNTWQLNVKAPTMLLIPPASYLMDMLAFGDGYTRRLVQESTVVVQQGITR
jgi:hypothetical protein